jgi:hypothetical protein
LQSFHYRQSFNYCYQYSLYQGEEQSKVNEQSIRKKLVIAQDTNSKSTNVVLSSLTIGKLRRSRVLEVSEGDELNIHPGD